MPRVGQYAAAPGQWAGNRQMLADIDEQSQRSQQNDLREQQLQFREAHAQQMEELGQQAARLHDQQVTAKLADEKLLQDQRGQALSDYTKMTNEISTGALKPNSPDYATQKAALMSRYPLAASMLDSDKNSGAASVLHTFDAANDTWMKSQSELLNKAVDMAKEYGVPVMVNPDGTPDAKGMQAATTAQRAGVQPDPSLAMKQQVIKDPITGEVTTYAAPPSAPDGPPEKIISQYAKAKGDMQGAMSAIGSTETPLQTDKDKLLRAQTEAKTLEGLYPSLLTPNQPPAAPIAPANPQNVQGPDGTQPTFPLSQAGDVVAPATQHDQALQWATDNPNDPRSAKIIATASAATAASQTN